VFTFPIPTYNVTPGFDYDDPRLDRLWEVTAKYGLPYFANFVNSDLSPEDARSMCCRLRLDTRTLERRGGGLFGASPLTGSIGVVTLNLPRLGHLARDEADLLARLDRLMDLARDSLVLKRKVLERYTEDGLYPYVRHYLRHIRARSGAYWRNHFSTIGLVGLSEAVENLAGVPFLSAEGRALGLRILDHMRARLERYQVETGTPFNLEATPAEGTSYRLARLDKDRHPGIRCANEEAFRAGAAPFYTNSSQLPVNATDDVFELLDHQDALQARYTGGTVQHVFVGEAIRDPATVRRFVEVVCTRYRLRQITLNLISNAIKFTEVGEVRVRARAASVSPKEAMLEMTVQDTGIGITSDVQQTLFQAFVQADSSTTRRYGGTGLGLAIVRRLVSLMGGEIHVTSEEGRGSTFQFTVRLGLPRAPGAGPAVPPISTASAPGTSPPVAPVAPVTAASPPPVPAPAAPASAPVERACLLLVEDNPMNQRVVTLMTERLGHAIDVVADGRAAIEAVASGAKRYDLILMDCHLPELDGFEATRRIRRLEGEAARTPIVALTASAYATDRQRCLDAGMDDFLAKPITFALFSTTLKRWLGD
jgi:signal transduction histidine kinase/CheY-like chemotaxis protein